MFDRSYDQDYLKLVLDCLEEPCRMDRTGVGTHSLFGRSLKIDHKTLPVLLSKHTNIDAVYKELAWFLRGETNTNTLGCKIWDAWAKPDGDCGPIYGAQWRGTDPRQPVDQIAYVLNELQNNPSSRRMVVSAWNPAVLGEQALPACHTMFQLYAEESHWGRRVLHMQMYQRSADLALGVPFNVLSYWMLLQLFARAVGMVPGGLTIQFGIAHVYANHEPELHKQHKYWSETGWLSKLVDASQYYLPWRGKSVAALDALQLGADPSDQLDTMRSIFSYVPNAPKRKFEVAV